MNLSQIRQRIAHLKTRIFGFVSPEQPYGRQEMDELATAITEYGRMRQKHYGSGSVVLGAGELAMRLRETTQTILKALDVLRNQGRAEETGPHGRWRLLPIVPGERRWTEHREKRRAQKNYVVEEMLGSNSIFRLPSLSANLAILRSASRRTFLSYVLPTRRLGVRSQGYKQRSPALPRVAGG